MTAKNTPAGNSSVTYDAAGNVTKYTDASGSVSYAYDANNNVVDVVEPGGTKTGCGTLGTLCTLFGYDKGNRTTSVKYPNGVIVAIGYNTPGQETSVTATRGSTVLVSQSYTYVNGTNNVGLRQTVADQALGALPGCRERSQRVTMSRFRVPRRRASSPNQMLYMLYAAMRTRQVGSDAHWVPCPASETPPMWIRCSK